MVGNPAGLWADEVDAAGGKIVELDGRIRELDGALKPPQFSTADTAERRVVDAQVLYELKNYESASIILFDVVERYPSSPVYGEALFYLADSLYLKRDFLSSRRFFEKIIEQGPQNKRYQESLQRLIELSLHTGDYAPVDGYIAKLEQLQVTQPLPSVPYVKGKYYYFRQQYDKALEAMRTIGPGHPYYFHSQYFIGAAQVAMGPAHLQEAEITYETLTRATPKTDSEKQILDLAHLAIARIQYERGNIKESLEEYGKIPTLSPLFNDSLYESAWANIKNKDYQKAAHQLDLLLTAAPDTPVVPEVKLLMGNLYIRQKQFTQATEQFGKTRDEFEPVYKQLQAELAGRGDAQAYFRELIAKNLDKFDAAITLTPLAVKWVKSEPTTERVVHLVTDVSSLRKSIEEADEIARRLDLALTGPGRVNVFPELATARRKAVEVSSQLLEIKQLLSDREAKLVEPIAGAEKGQFDALQKERAGLEKQLASLPTSADGITERQRKAREALNEVDKLAAQLQAEANSTRAQTVATQKLYHDDVARRLTPEQRQYAEQEIGNYKSEIEKQSDAADGLRRELADAMQAVGVDDADMRYAAEVKARYNGVLQRLHNLGVQLRSRLSAGDRSRAEQIESILERANAVDTKVAAFNGRIEQLLDVQLKDLLAAVVDEKAHLASYRTTLGGYTTESEDVGGGIIAENFKAVADRFYQVVIRSDVGVIDVAWALKDSHTQSTKRLVNERQREFKQLDDQYRDVLKESP